MDTAVASGRHDRGARSTRSGRSSTSILRSTTLIRSCSSSSVSPGWTSTARCSSTLAELAPAKRRGLYAALPFIGIFSGLALATDLLPGDDANAQDLGLVNVSANLGQLLGPVVGAGLIAAVGGFWLLFAAAAVFSALGAALTATVRVPAPRTPALTRSSGRSRTPCTARLSARTRASADEVAGGPT